MSAVPWSAVQAILQTHGDTMQVILLALPHPPVQMRTPKLVAGMFSKEDFGESMNSFVLLRLYMVCWHWFTNTLGSTPRFDEIDARLKDDQKQTLRDTALDARSFALQYLHSYETAMVRCMHLVALKDTKSPDPSLTDQLMAMEPATVQTLGIGPYLTPRAPPTSISKQASGFIARLTEQQQQLAKEMDAVAASSVDETTAALRKLAVSTSEPTHTPVDPKPPPPRPDSDVELSSTSLEEI